MAFNMLDDDFTTEQNGYTPSFTIPSRTGSMKKFSKKEQRPNTATTLQKPAPMKPIVKDEFDDLLNQLIDSKQKSATKRPNTSILSTGNKNTSILDDLKFSDDSAFGQRESITFNQKTLPKPLEPGRFNQSLMSRDSLKLSEDFGSSIMNNRQNIVINQDQDTSPLRSRRESTLRKQSPKNVIIEDDSPSMTIGSSRMMRPPLGRKPSVQNLQSQNKQSIGLTINEDASRLAQTSEAGRFGGRRGSSTAQTPKESISNPKQEWKFNIQSAAEDEPRLSRQSSSQFPQRGFQQKSINDRSMNQTQTMERPVERVVERIIEKVVEGPKIDISGIKEEHKKEINLLKESYEKQIKILTDNYQRQLREQKQAKNKVMNDMRDMIDKQRQKSERILKQQTDRVKKMSDWEKQKLETTYQSEIERLKGIVSSQEKSIPQPSISYLEKRRMEDLEQKLKYQLESVENQKKKLSKIESDLEQRQTEFNKFKSAEQKKLKDEYLKNNEKTFKDLKRISDEKNQIAAQKQRIALEMAQLEMDILQKQEKLATQQESLKAHQDSFERMKQDSEALNQQLYNNYKQKLQQAQESKNNVLLLQNDLLNKLKIVQLKGKQVLKGEPQNQLFRNTFQPSKTGFIPSRPQSVAQSRFVPEDNSKRMKNVENYMKTQGLTMGNTGKLSNNNTSFTLDKFIKNVDGYKKEKKEMIF